MHQAPCKHFRAFSHIIIVIPDKKGLLLFHFMGEEIEVQTDEVNKPTCTTSKCPNGQTQARDACYGGIAN